MVFAGSAEAELTELGVGLGVAGEVRLDEVIGHELEAAGGGNLGVKLADTAGSEVAGVGEGLEVAGELLLVEGVKIGFEDDDFAADFYVTGSWNAQGDVFNGADVHGDIFADQTVAAGDGLF